MSALKRTQPAPSAHALRGRKLRRKAKSKATVSSHKPRTQPNMQRRKAKPRVVRKPLTHEVIHKLIVNGFTSIEREKLDVREDKAA